MRRLLKRAPSSKLKRLNTLRQRLKPLNLQGLESCLNKLQLQPRFPLAALELLAMLYVLIDFRMGRMMMMMMMRRRTSGKRVNHVRMRRSKLIRTSVPPPQPHSQASPRRIRA